MAWLLGLGTSVVTAAIAASAFGAVTIYGGGAGSENGYTFGPWGGGAAAESKDVARAGGHSIKVTTRGFFSGGQLSLARPVDVKGLATDPNNLMVFYVYLPEAATGGGYGTGGVVGPTAGGAIGGPTKGGPPGPGPTGGGVRPGGQIGTGDATPINVRNLRVLISTDDGKLSEVYFRVYRHYHAQSGWHGYALPITKIPGFDRTNGRINGFRFFADAPTTFYVGEITAVNDATPISGEILAMNTNLARDDEPAFLATGQAGETPLLFYWDWDLKDGVQMETEGPAVYHRFRVPGDYTVTLTIADAYGVKKPFQTTIQVTVNP